MSDADTRIYASMLESMMAAIAASEEDLMGYCGCEEEVLAHILAEFRSSLTGHQMVELVRLGASIIRQRNEATE